MIVTEVYSEAGDSEACAAGNIEVPESDSELSYEVLGRGLSYYLEGERETGAEAIGKMTERRGGRDAEFSEFFFRVENDSKEFQADSFAKTFKTLVDIVAEPIVDECTSPSDASDAEEEDVYGLIPAITTLSQEFVRRTTRFFGGEGGDLVDLGPAEETTEKTEGQKAAGEAGESADADDGGEAHADPAGTEAAGRAETRPEPAAKSKEWTIGRLSKWF